MSWARSVLGFDSRLAKWVQVCAWVSAFVISGVWIKVGFWPAAGLVGVLAVLLLVLKAIDAAGWIR